MTEHTKACWAMPECLTCGLHKHPRGRDPGVAAANGYCGVDCPGYNQEPLSGHFWPSEEPLVFELEVNNA